MILETQGRENTRLPVLKEQLRDTEKRLSNLLEAIERGILTPTTKQRLDELEARRSDLKASILEEGLQRPTLSREQILFWFEQFRQRDVSNPAYQRQIIDNFVNSVYIFEDRVVLNFNFKENAKTIPLREVLGSSADGNGPPQTRSFGCGFSFCPAHGRVPLSFLKAAPCFFAWPARTGGGQVDSRRTNAPGITTVGAKGCLWDILRHSCATTVRAISSTSTRWVVRGGLQMVE